MKPFLFLISLSLILFPITSFAQTKGASEDTTSVKVDLSGEHGKDGKDGTSYSRRAGTGVRGQNGGNATEATPGQAAGEVLDLEIKSSTDDTFTVDVRAITPGRKEFTFNSQPKAFNGTPQVSIVTIGGNGGHGARGGNGQQGGKGADGADATRFSSGTNGDDGARGGDGGYGTSGKDPGLGGNAKISVPVKQLELLTLIESQTFAGKIGKPGQHGNAGAGGPGGAGGSSYSWTESHTRTNSKGESESYTTYHSNPGGSSGSTGPSGSKPTAPLHRGQIAEDGRVRFEVFDEAGQRTSYEERYFLTLESYDVVSENKDGIIEPGEKVTVRSLTVKNTGKMPLPHGVPAIVFLRDSKYLISQGIELNVPLSLAPGATHTFNELNIEFEVRKGVLQPQEERSLVYDRLNPEARMSRVEVPMTEFDNPRMVEITFPIEIEPIEALHGLAPGEASRFRFKITNISERDFGSNSKLKRTVEFLVRRNGGDIPGNQVHFYDPQGVELPLESGIYEAIANLKAGESAAYEGIVALDPDVESYNPTYLSTKLSLERVHTEGQIEVIQDRNFRVRAVETYFHTPGSQFLLVTNEALERRAFVAWKQLFESYGTTGDTWDLSYYNFIDLMKRQGDLDSGSTILEDFRGKTLIFLTNYFSDSQKQAEIEDYLRQADVMTALMKYDIRFYFVGENDKRSLWNSFLSPHQITHVGAEVFGTGNELADAIIDEQLREKAFPNGDAYLNSEIPLVKSKWKLGKKAPDREGLINEALHIENEVNRRAPEKNLVVVHTYKPQISYRFPGFFGFLNRWEMGSISVLSRPDTQKDIGVHAMVDIETMNSPEYILGKSNRINLLLAMPFEALMHVYNKHLSVREPTEESIRQLQISETAILISLIEEQNRLRSFTLKGGLKTADIERILGKLTRFAKSSKTLLYRNSSTEAIESVINIMGFLNFHNAEMNSFLSSFLLPYETRSRWIESYTKGQLEILAQSFFSFQKRNPVGLFLESFEPPSSRRGFRHSEIAKLVKERAKDHKSELLHLGLEQADLSRAETLEALKRRLGYDASPIARGQSEVLSREDFVSRKAQADSNSEQSEGNELRSQARKTNLSVPHPGVADKLNAIQPTGRPVSCRNAGSSTHNP